jgi:hypothetical protein
MEDPAGQHHDPDLPGAERQAAERRRVEDEIHGRYAAELAGADICDSLQIEMRIRAEIEQALEAAAAASASRRG